MGKKVMPVQDPREKIVGYAFHCDGCGHAHMFYTHNPGGPQWTFVNNNMEKPTFRASLLVNKDHSAPGPRCHLFVTDGKIQYLNDCTHNLKGQTIQMEDVD